MSIVPVTESFSAGRFAELAHGEIDSALAAGRRPIVVGGTGLYLQAALTDLELRPPPPPGLRERLLDDARERGIEALHAELAERSPSAAAAIPPTDRTRVIRGLELLEMGEEPAPAGTGSRLWTADLRHPTLLAGLTMERERCMSASTRGWPRWSAPGPRRRCGSPTPRAPRAPRASALGFEELLRGDVDAMRRRTRNYARRQLTWMRGCEGVWVDWTRAPRSRPSWPAG